MKTFILIKLIAVLIGFIVMSMNLSTNASGIVLQKVYEPAKQMEVDSYSVLFDAPVKELKLIPEKYILILDHKGSKIECPVDRANFRTFKVGDVYRYPKLKR